MSKLLESVLSKTYNMDGEQLAALLYKKAEEGDGLTDEYREDAESILLDINAKRIAQLKAEKAEARQKAFDEAKGKTSEAYERWLRENFGVDPDKTLKGEELVKAVKTATATTKMDPDDVKRTKVYLEAESRFQQEKAAIVVEWEARFKAKEQESEREKMWTEASRAIADAVDKTPNLNKAVLTPGLVSLFASKYRGYDFQQEGENLYPVRDGKRVENKQGFAVTLRQLVESDAMDTLPMIAQTPAGNSGNAPGGSPAITKRWADEATYLKELNEARPDERPALRQAWKLQQ